MREIPARRHRGHKPLDGTDGGESGQIIIIFALTMTVMLVFLTLVFDAGRLYVEKRSVQTSVDAASFGGLRKTLTEIGKGTYDDRAVRRTLADYAQSNGIPSDGTSENYSNIEAYYVDRGGSRIGPQIGKQGLVPTNAVSVEVAGKKNSRSFFGGLLGKSGLETSSEARTEFFQKAALMPLGMPEQSFQAGKRYNLRDPTIAETQYGVKNYDNKSFDLANPANGGDKYEAATDYGSPRRNAERWAKAQGYNGQQKIGNRMAVFRSNVNNAVHDGLDYNIPRQNLSDLQGRYGYLYVLIWDSYTFGSGPNPDMVTISAFTRFKVYEDDVDDDEIWGYFEERITDPLGKIDLQLVN